MRGQQLARICQLSMPRRTISYAPLGTPFRNSTLFLTKGALKSARPDDLAALRRRGNLLAFDVVDEEPPAHLLEPQDVLVAASITAFIELPRAFPSHDVRLVNHHVDPRITAHPIIPPIDRLRMAYFGELVNAMLSPRISERLEPVAIDTSRPDSAWIEALPHYNCHYAVRATRDLDHHKPFLKGFTAAHCSSNVVIQATNSEAVHWLGEDYPFFIRGEATEATILAMLERVSDSFGGAEWQHGLAVMRDVRERTTPSRIAAEVGRAF